MRRIILSLVLLCALAGAGRAQAPTDTVLTIEEALRIGLENNFAIRIARTDAEAAETRGGLGTSGFLPTLDVTGGYTLGTEDEETNSPFSFGSTDTENLRAGVSLNWTIFDGFRMFVDNRRYDALARLGIDQARARIEAQVVAITSTYFNLVQQQQLLDIAGESRAISKERLDKERVRRELGGASSTDLLNATVSYNNDQARFLDQRLQVELVRDDLNVLLGREPGTSLRAASEIVVPPLELTYNEIYTQAESNNASLEVARRNVLVVRNAAKAARAPFMPRLSLNAGYDYTDISISPDDRDDIETQSDAYSVGLNLSYNLFNANRDKIALELAQLDARAAEYELKQQRLELSRQIRENLTTFQRRMELVELEQQNLVAARQNLELQRDRYQTGVATSLDFRDAQLNLLRAQQSLTTARYQARIARLQLEQLMGTLEISL